MSRATRVWLAIGALLIVGYALDGNEDPETWAIFFWLSAAANVLLLMLLPERKS